MKKESLNHVGRIHLKKTYYEERQRSIDEELFDIIGGFEVVTKNL